MNNRGSTEHQALESLAVAAHRRKWLAVAVFSLAAASGVTVALSLPDVYRSTAAVLVDQGGRTDPTAQAEVESRLQLLSQEIFSRARLESLITEFGLYPGLVQRSSAQAAVGQMRRDIRTEFKGGAGTTIAFTISYRSPDRLAVAKVANALASFYVEGDKNIHERQIGGAVRVLKAQLDDLKRSLQEQEVALTEFQVTHMGELPQQADANLANLQRLQAELRTTSEERMRALDRRNDLGRQMADAAAAEASVGGPSPAAARLAKLKEELVLLNKRYSDKYPDVIRLTEEVAVLEKEVAQTPSDVGAGAAATSGRSVTRLRESLNEVDAEITERKSDEARLRAEIAEHIRRLENAPRQQRTYQEISRDYQTRHDLYDSLRKRYEQAQLEDSQGGQPASAFRILDSGVVPASPDAPNRLVLSLGAILAALALAAGAAMLAERLDTSFHAADEIRSFTRIPVLASIPVIVTDGDRRAGRRRFCLGAVSLVLALGVVVPVSHRFARNKVGLVALLGR